MSLDVYLTIPDCLQPLSDEPRIFIREAGQTRQISRTEWDTRYPDREPVTMQDTGETTTVYSANITHNLNRMADAAGIYEVLWRPEEIGITKAWQLIEPLHAGLEKLTADPEAYTQFNPANGWGNYTVLCAFVAQYLATCEQYPQAEVSICR
jgi:hypothetical protein